MATGLSPTTQAVMGFAQAALQGLAANPTYGENVSLEQTAADAWRLAEQMMQQMPQEYREELLVAVKEWSGS
jgi:hypothetical protein